MISSLMWKRLLAVILAATFLGGCNLAWGSNAKSALQVNSDPAATVFLNGEHVGLTPHYDDKLKPGEYLIKLQVGDQPEQQWQTKVILAPKVVTVLSKSFGPSEEESAHYLLQLEPLGNSEATEISIVTQPDNAIVKLDGQPQGFSPVSIKEASTGDHTLVFSAPGYQEQTVKAQVRAGFKLIVSAKLAKNPPDLTDDQETPEATGSGQLDNRDSSPSGSIDNKPVTPSPTSQPNSSGQINPPYVTILDTGTGWLRVRSEPSAYADNEVGRVTVGKRYRFIEATETGWYKIEYESNKEGYIVSRYANLTRE